MFHKCIVQNMKCLGNVTFKIQNNASKIQCPKHEMFEKRDVQNMKYFKNFMQKCNIYNIKCSRNVTFKT